MNFVIIAIVCRGVCEMEVQNNRCHPHLLAHIILNNSFNVLVMRIFNDQDPDRSSWNTKSAPIEQRRCYTPVSVCDNENVSFKVRRDYHWDKAAVQLYVGDAIRVSHGLVLLVLIRYIRLLVSQEARKQ